MDAQNAAVEADLENGGGGGGGSNVAVAVVEAWPSPADPGLKEKQPFTCLRAVPYIVAILVAVVMVAVGIYVVLASDAEAERQGQALPYRMTTKSLVGTVLYAVGTALLVIGLIAACTVADGNGDYACNLQRFGPD